MNARTDREQRALTSRRGFVVATSFGAVSLYGLWGVLGAAPVGFGHGGHGTDRAAESDAGGHGGHGAAVHGPSVAEFETSTAAFMARHRQSDGSIRVDAPVAAGAIVEQASHGAHAGSPGAMSTTPAAADPATGGEVYLLARKWMFEPDTLRLRAGATYRFRMMAVDASHGAAIQLGRGSRIIRLRLGALVEQELRFTRSGEYLVYCTSYCGIGHDRMSGRIIVS